MELETVNCLLCDSNRATVLSRQGDNLEFGICKCSDCGFVYMSPRPTASSINELYNEEYYKDGSRGYYDYEQTFHTYEQVYRGLFAIREKLIRQFKSPGRLLEIGCAYGFHLAFLRENGWDVTGTDVSPVSSRYAREKLNLNVLTGDSMEINFEKNSFDVVLLIDVLEHLHYPEQELNKIKYILKPGGILYIQVPYELFHWEEIMEALLQWKKPGTIRPDALPAHLYYFSPRTLKQFLVKCGYKIIHRASGNYGEIRSKIVPPDTLTGPVYTRILKKAYFEWGVQRLLYFFAKKIKQGNGVIYIAQPDK